MNKCVHIYLFIIAVLFHSLAFSASSNKSQAALVNSLVPLINTYNHQLTVDRQRVYKIAEKYLHNDDINETDFNWLKKTADIYQLKPQKRNDQAFFNALLKRVDTIPASLIVALIIADGAWQQNKSVCLVACSQAKTIEQQIARFFMTVNTQNQYLHFREQRHVLRQQKQALTGRQLADSLLSSPAYLQQRHIIKKLLTTYKWQKMDNL